MKPKYFKSSCGKVPLPVFFPDATQAVVKSIDTTDIKSTKTPGILVNTYHLYRTLGIEVVSKFGGIRNFMSWDGALISDSGGFQVMSLAKKGNLGKVTYEGVKFKGDDGKIIMLTPEKSIQFQFSLEPDMLVVLDDFTPPGAGYNEAKKTVERTILWAMRSKDEYLKLCKKFGLDKKTRPYLLAVVQGGENLELREYCTRKLVELGFDGLGYGGWPIKEDGKFNYRVAECIAEYSPSKYFLYGLGIGKPEEIIGCFDLGYQIFDCVLPTRDARHRRLYVYNAKSIDKIDVHKSFFYSFYTPDNKKYKMDRSPVSLACDCLLCKKYSRAYLMHLFRINEVTAGRLATIHNLRFYSILMEKLRNYGS